MKKILKKIHSRQKGFTLIELLVVIAIIAILAAIIVPNIGGYVERGEVAAEQSELAMVRNAVAAVMAAGGIGDLDVAETAGVASFDDLVDHAIWYDSATDTPYDLTIDNDLGTFMVSEYFANGLVDLDGKYYVNRQGYVSTDPALVW